jgi:O-antigen/teichoic acid export membrane protein
MTPTKITIPEIVKKTHFNISLLKKSILIFLKYAILIALFFAGMPYLINMVFKNEVYDLFIQTVPILIPLIVLDYISLALNAYLIGNDKIWEIGKISIIEMIINGLLGYLLLFEFDLNISPLLIILYVSLVSKVIQITLMYRYIRKYIPKVVRVYPIKESLFDTLRIASFYPAIFDMVYQIGTFALFMYCSSYFANSQTALLTMFFSYLGILSVSSDAFSETSLNNFSSIYSKKYLSLFPKLSTKIIETSLLTSFVLLILIILLDMFLYGFEAYKLVLFLIVTCIIIFDTYSEIYSIAIIVRLKNDLFATANIIYGIITIIGVLGFTCFWKFEAVSILLCMLVAQIVTYVYLKNKSNSIWTTTKNILILNNNSIE